MLPLTCDAILFDLDGVLLDSNHIYEQQWRIWARQRDISYAHILEVHHGRPVSETIRIVAPHLNALTEAEAYRDGLLAGKNLDSVRSFPGAASLLHTLPSSRWAIATSAPRASAIQMLHLAALPMPDIFVSGDDIGVGKPAPYPYLRAAWGLNQQIERCVVIEDAPAGVMSGQSAGAQVIAVRTTNPPDSLKQADLIVNTVADLTVEYTGLYLKIYFQQN